MPQNHSSKKKFKNIPYPTTYQGIWSYFSVATPAGMLSYASIIVLISVLFFLWTNPLLRELFQLPSTTLLIVVSLSTLLSWVIMLSCSRRPSKRLYRYWNILLVISNSILLVMIAIEYPWVKTPLFHASVSAISAATFVLLPRLIRLSANSWWLQKISIISLFIVLSITIPTIMLGQDKIINDIKQQIVGLIEQIKRETQIINNFTALNWLKIPTDPTKMKQHLARLQQSRIGTLVVDSDTWRKSRIFQLDEQLLSVSKQKIIAIAKSVSPSLRPTLATISDPAIYYDGIDKHWVTNAEFLVSANITNEYYQSVNQLLINIKPKQQDILDIHAKTLLDFYQQKQQQFYERLQDFQYSWINSWLLTNLDHKHRISLGLKEFLTMPITTEQLRAIDVWQWLAMPLHKLKQLKRDNATLGCRFPEYEHKRTNYFRLDCYAYHLPSKKSHVEPIMEMRVVYRQKKLSDNLLPQQLYFIFPIPTQNTYQYKHKVIKTFVNTIEDVYPEISVKTRGTGSTITNGVTLKHTKRQSIRIYKPQIKPYAKGRKMVELMIEHI